jgi:hypothetical protein
MTCLSSRTETCSCAVSSSSPVARNSARASGQLILAGSTLGTVNIGLVIFEALDEQAARQVMAEDPVVLGGYAPGKSARFGYRCCAGETDLHEIII